MKKFLAIALVPLFAIGGCAKLGEELQAADNWIGTYAPLAGKDILLVDDILVTAYCSPALNTAGSTASNILNIVAPDSNAASRVANRLSTNVQITQQLCPAVAQIKALIGTVPAAAPSQTITTQPVVASPNAIPIS